MWVGKKTKYRVYKHIIYNNIYYILYVYALDNIIITFGSTIIAVCTRAAIGTYNMVYIYRRAFSRSIHSRDIVGRDFSLYKKNMIRIQ